MRQTLDLTVKTNTLAVDALAEASSLPKQRIKDAMAKGACWWVQKGKQVRLRKAKRELKAGSRIQLFYDDQVLARKPEQPTLIENKGRYSVWYKPHGLLAQGSQWGDHCSLLRLAEVATNTPCFLVHRLDADAAGLMLIAHDPKAAGALSQLFSGRTVTKIYHATVIGQLEAADRLIDDPLDGKDSVSRVTTLALDDQSNTTQVKVLIETGRKHQIRRHLAGIGHAIVGDRLYGLGHPDGLQLEAVLLAFTCPISGVEVTFKLPD
ncbi:MAG: tRNA pseudouridine32 synthase / 23S rRNA pseudouridine746 synthase [Marinobacter excellens HL-55]|uniref:tRNA pseudouridine32 synthase / 23S rRNA pseudouridine746 synthase n=1 Tax=Marinobacter excellens HL-55 TaxID=1305731 RepID=A0A0P7YLG1_9GAMM|nr:MAG: tRNA pseudouridine32 synthase / 23S rRNA pseudouridine746 synthase [Marinobacter excellens HL-55]